MLTDYSLVEEGVIESGDIFWFGEWMTAGHFDVGRPVADYDFVLRLDKTGDPVSRLCRKYDRLYTEAHHLGLSVRAFGHGVEVEVKPSSTVIRRKDEHRESD